MTPKYPLAEDHINKLAKDAVNSRKLLDLWYAHEPYYRFLSYLVRDFNPEFAIELGIARGTGLAHMALGSLSTKVIGVDHDMRFVVDEVKRINNVTLVQSDTIIWLKKHKDNQFERCLFHIDSEHTSEQSGGELAEVKRIARNSIICLDDVRFSDDMSNWWDGLLGKKMEFPELHVKSYGVILLGD
jgi:cephalosporin hydroxylase